MKLIYSTRIKKLLLLSIFLMLGAILSVNVNKIFNDHRNINVATAENQASSGKVSASQPHAGTSTENGAADSTTQTLQALPSPSTSITSPMSEEARLIANVEDYFLRLNNVGVSNAEAGAMANTIQSAISRSPALRAYFAKRLQRAFKERDTLALFELESAFTTTKETFDAMLPIYKDVINDKDDLDYYAIQTLGYMQPWLTDTEKQNYVDRAVEQLNRYSSSDYYAGPLGYLSRTAENPDAHMLPSQRSAAISAVRNRMESASTAPAQYATAAALFSLSSPQDAQVLAQDLLSRPPSLGYLHATLNAMASGRLAYDPAIVLAGARIFQSGSYQGGQADSVLQLLEALKKPLGG